MNPRAPIETPIVGFDFLCEMPDGSRAWHIVFGAGGEFGAGTLHALNQPGQTVAFLAKVKRQLLGRVRAQLTRECLLRCVKPTGPSGPMRFYELQAATVCRVRERTRNPRPEWRCARCNGFNVEHAHWVNLNSGEVGDIFGSFCNGDNSFCNDCDDHTQIEANE